MLRMLESSGVCFGASLPKWFAPDPALSCQSPSTKESADKLPTPTNMIHPLNLPPLSAIPTTPSSKPGRRPNSDPRAQHYKPRKSIYSCATKTGSSTQKAFWRAKKQSNAKIQKLTKQVNTLQCDKHNLKKETKSLKEIKTIKFKSNFTFKSAGITTTRITIRSKQKPTKITQEQETNSARI
eukprot:205006_1